jgi:RimJ/RimL family protein N-acetyltransferase
MKTQKINLPGLSECNNTCSQDLYKLWKKQQRADRTNLWIVRVGNVPIGLVYATIDTDSNVFIDVLIHPEHSGQGYGTEATKAVMKYLFSFNVQIICSASDNNSWERVLQKLGFTDAGSGKVLEESVRIFKITKSLFNELWIE